MNIMSCSKTAVKETMLKYLISVEMWKYKNLYTLPNTETKTENPE